MAMDDPEWKIEFRRRFGSNPAIEKFFTQILIEIIAEVPEHVLGLPSQQSTDNIQLTTVRKILTEKYLP
jgi:hypothetical protein